MKKSFIIAAIITAALALSSCKKQTEEVPAAQEKIPVVGISKLLAHPALNATEEGIKDELEKRGIKVRYDLQNANADINIANSIASKYKSEGTDITVGIGTPMAVALTNAIKDKPIVFAAISDPVAAGLVPNTEKGGKNVTGVSDAVDIELQINNFRSIVPFKKLGFIYTNSEDNSVVMKNITEAVCAKLGIEFIPSSITNVTEIKQAAESLIGRVDAFFVINDNNICSSLSALTSTAKAHNIPVFSSDPASSLQFGGVLYTAGVDYYIGGRLAGAMIAELLNGSKTTEEIPVRFMRSADETMTIVDQDVVKALGVSIPANLISESTVFIENGKVIE
ncbi:MAG: ABC transporter substrate-binding protein [Mucispirillum sp.]|nr:ABC transporter substrate-binding protein [Mucispirillum sp.]